MATSRTGTARWKQVRAQVLREAREAGLTHCPCAGDCKHHRGRVCSTRLDYELGRTPASAEADHVVPHARGGRDDVENARVVCRRCNQARGDKPLSAPTAQPATTTTLVRW